MKKMLMILSGLILAALLLIHPERASEAVQNGLLLCFRTVVPSLFPFLAVSSLLLRLGLGSVLRSLCAPFMGPLFRLPGVCAAPLVMGLIGGYPTGAKAAAELYDQGAVTKGESELLLGFCNNCGPGFLIGFVGAGVLGSVQAGAYLLLIHMTAALLTGVLLCHLPRKATPPSLPCRLPMQNPSLSEAVTSSVSAALTAILGICAYVVLFRTAAALLPPLPPAVLGAVEMVSGMAALQPDAAGFVTAAALSAWGGVSVHCQTISVAGELSLKYHTVGKAVQAVISLLLAAIATRFVYR